MRALVTGGAGFVGSHLVDRLLAEDNHVDVVDDLSTGSLGNLSDARRSAHRRLTFHQLDVRDRALSDLMARARPDVVYHLAARPIGGDPRDDVTVTVTGTLEVLEGARAAGVAKVVFATSGAHIYGIVAAADLPVRESYPQRPVGLHGAAKKAVGDFLVAYRELHSLEYTALALGHVYGPRQAPGPGAVVAAFAERLSAGQPCEVTGDGRQTRDFVYVDDAVDAFARAAERGGGLLLNVATGRETSVRQLFELMSAAAGSHRQAARAPETMGEVRRISLDPARASIHLGWRPWTSLKDGLAATLEWWSTV